MNHSDPWPEPDPDLPFPQWNSLDLELFGLVIRIMELTPNLERLEHIFLHAADLVHRIRSTPENP
jgi:hypothetical protein